MMIRYIRNLKRRVVKEQYFTRNKQITYQPKHLNLVNTSRHYYKKSTKEKEIFLLFCEYVSLFDYILKYLKS